MRKLVLLSVLLVLAVIVVACGRGAPPPPAAPPITRARTPTPIPQHDEAAIRQLIDAEGEAVVQQDIDRLQGMWASDGVVTDANHTPDHPKASTRCGKGGKPYAIVTYISSYRRIPHLRNARIRA